MDHKIASQKHLTLERPKATFTFHHKIYTISKCDCKLVKNELSMYFQRDISERIRKLGSQYPAVILTGARQTGKTTLLKEIYPDHKYISLDLPSDAELAENDPEQFFKLVGDDNVIIDEAQYAPKMFRYLKILIDKNRKSYGKFILTGSQKFNLMKEVSDSLAGRCVWLELEGLSLSELSSMESVKNGPSFLLQFMVRGSQPELWERPELDPSEYYRTYLATYLERDVRQIVNISSLRDFERFLRIMAVRNGQLLNFSDVAKDVGTSPNTVKQWTSILEASNQIYLLEPYFSNTGKRVIKSPKVYFNEVGMLSFLLGFHKGNIEQSPFIGNLWETLVCSEFRKAMKNKKPQSSLWFYRDQQAREVDFLFEHSNSLDFFEIKWSTAVPNDKDLKSLHGVYKDMEKKGRLMVNLGKKFLLSRVEKPYLKGDVEVLNLDYFRTHAQKIP